MWKTDLGLNRRAVLLFMGCAAILPHGFLFRARGRPTSPAQQVLDFWDRVLFTNYIQRVFNSDRVRPSPADWVLGRAVLSKLVSEYRPDIIVVLGLQLRSPLDWFGQVAPDVAVAHPSSFGFKYDDWLPTVREAFAWHGNRRA